jgi:DNA invertase Pin-like site-specific DNA recombinase
MTNAAGYLRISTQGQVRDGYSLAYQRDESHATALTKTIFLHEANDDGLLLFLDFVEKAVRAR